MEETDVEIGTIIEVGSMVNLKSTGECIRIDEIHVIGDAPAYVFDPSEKFKLQWISVFNAPCPEKCIARAKELLVCR
ncbi:MAG: hypothetical protein COZ49_01910 [Candidatus Yonathbacteria bacterium CG_4_10_14_3_um_filter_47_65]|uniref:Uncharacterized protein n=2 Tax=Parcubacteria group TaxID=1794811 RepID=A0A2M8D8L2_9BACT|nr:MAG: hypothetical protein AUJ44_00895 [Candidatus Nomurabacteria bacterium CG1_02_47_685]PIP03522.1 MAG: hypothetical protein COX54_03255 [Candidatus Yonathbacteria bacterium CG23_combo_of_CG06-09_8_20_14_all_46_18]PIQ32613.1 MAG: hypothetical protein COW61_01205 [Candidatus Yonathbacteria bacterium CG17_big_fil_post_rev_8_21_14_2_50_46_19]PIX56461.1 MAG: hypothetical protein COZ49_01910 [Candidatus Yonathbacteria bacterium CG_4_10_14_3_um_filter_47_65]PIY57553.1 MAG: hypothetical protein CO